MNSSQLPEGYKLTEVGVIPEDWEIRPCSELSDRIMVGIVIRPAQYYVSQGVPAFRSANIRESGISNSDLVFISESANALLVKSQTRPGDILTVRTGYPGTSAVVGSEHAGCNCIDILITRPSKRVNSNYLAIWINSSFGKEQVLRNQGGLAQQHFNVGDMRSLLVAVPSLTEQRSIASTLSDIDALLSELDKLIAKKRDLKQAAMQQLLTGRTRLPEFSKGREYRRTEIGLIPEDWDVSILNSVSSVPMQNGVFYKPSHKGTGVKLINVGDLYRQTPINHEELELFAANDDEKRRFKVENGDLFFTRSSVVPSGIAHCNVYLSEQNEDVVFDSHIIRVRPSYQVDPRYLFRYCVSSSARKYLVSHAKTGTMTTIDQGVLGKCPVLLPQLEEQRAIAKILSDMDTEIATLEQRRHKTRNLKHAMMQELLTGRIRLKIEA